MNRSSGCPGPPALIGVKDQRRSARQAIDFSKYAGVPQGCLSTMRRPQTDQLITREKCHYHVLYSQQAQQTASTPATRRRKWTSLLGASHSPWRRGSRWFSGFSIAQRFCVSISTDLVHQRLPPHQPPPQSLNKPLIPLPPLRLRCRLGGVRQGRRACQPEADEQRQRLVRHRHVPLQSFQVTRHPVKPTRQGGLQSVCSVRRQMRRQGCLHDHRLGSPFAGGVVGKFDGEVRRQAEGVFGSHRRSHPHVVGGVHRRLACRTGERALH